ncbi:hypothetical protein AB28_5475 [Raoultella ornithinolytica 2-156-04_S1_C2]|nr:hypothetical protein AB00_5484 [Raoultella ornithinolytica 2-156-04_S1_C1]KDX08991.1 hypothetical protein AB28_5475 [Raoultella ornithinolytica 2-156-04_S1_C2]
MLNHFVLHYRTAFVYLTTILCRLQREGKWGDGRKCTFFRLDHKMLQRLMRATNRPFLPGLRTGPSRTAVNIAPAGRFPDSGITPWPGLRTGPSRSPGKRRTTGEVPGQRDKPLARATRRPPP